MRMIRNLLFAFLLFAGWAIIQRSIASAFPAQLKEYGAITMGSGAFVLTL
jgi:hypothetical protein